MNVQLVILHPDPSRGGAERYTVDLAAGLASRGHDVTLVSSGPWPTGIETKYAHVELPARGFTRVGRYRSFLRSVDAYLVGIQDAYDVVHAMLPISYCDVYHPHAGVARPGATAWNVVFNPRRVAMARVERNHLTSRHSQTLVLCLSDYVKRFVRQSYPQIADDRLVRLFNAVDLQRFAPPTDREPATWINALMIAQDYERKGLREAIAAMAKVPDTRLRLLVVGKQDPAAYASLAKQLGVSDRVVFHPPTKSPEDFYRQADFFVLPTRHDPCSLVVLEALAMGLPVISTKFNGACEIMTPGVHGFVLDDPADVDALASAMRDLCDDGRRAQMSRACAELRPKLAFENHLDELERIYAQAIARRDGNQR